MDVQGLGRTHVGLRRRDNQDAFLADPDQGLFVVCDGMGGANGGRLAATTATAAIRRTVAEYPDVVRRAEFDPARTSELVALLADAVQRAGRDVYDRASTEPSLAGMGCTATAVLFAGDRGAMAHVGDSRLYLVREGRAHQLSSDHTLAADLVRQGVLPVEALNGHPHAHLLTRVVGTQPVVEVETLSFGLEGGDTFLVCSDGLGKYLSPEWLASQVAELSVEDLPDSLIDYAIGKGGDDNVTVIAVGVEGPPPTAEMPAQSPRFALDVLGASFLFGDLNLAQLSRVIECADMLRLSAGDLICQKGEIFDKLLIVVSGSLSVTGPGGRQAIVGPYQHLGEQLVLRPRPVRATISAETAVDVLAISNESLQGLARRRPWLGVALYTRIVERLSADMDRMTDPSGDLPRNAPRTLL